MPTLVDVSVVDDAFYIDRISQQAMNAGLAPITVIGADAAHASLHKGLQRQWSRAEEGWLRIEVSQGRADTEADLLVLVATTYRPLGVRLWGYAARGIAFALGQSRDLSATLPLSDRFHFAACRTQQRSAQSRTAVWAYRTSGDTACGCWCVEALSLRPLIVLVRLPQKPHGRFCIEQPEFGKHATDLQAQHARDKHGKLTITLFTEGAAPVLMADFIYLHRVKGTASGLSGSVTDGTDSSQSNRRAEEIASFAVVHSLLETVPGSLGTAVYSLVHAAYPSAFKDAPSKDPIVPRARLALLAFVHTFHTFNVLALTSRSDGQPAYSLKAHDFAAQTRRCVCGALPALVAIQLQQAEDSATLDQTPAVLPEEHGSENCGESFSFGRSSEQQHTGNVSAGKSCFRYSLCTRRSPTVLLQTQHRCLVAKCGFTVRHRACAAGFVRSMDKRMSALNNVAVSTL